METRTRKKYSGIIAIDPDVDGSGVAFLESRTLCTFRMHLPQLVKFLEDFKERNVLVVVEASYLVSGNWHLKEGDSSKASAAIGRKVGRNHEVGRQIVEFCRYFGISYEEKLPLKKIWHSRDGKITKAELEDLCKGSGIQFQFASNDQEQRDAALLAIDRSGIPMIMPPKISKHKVHNNQ